MRIEPTVVAKDENKENEASINNKVKQSKGLTEKENPPLKVSKDPEPMESKH